MRVIARWYLVGCFVAGFASAAALDYAGFGMPIRAAGAGLSGFVVWLVFGRR